MKSFIAYLLPNLALWALILGLLMGPRGRGGRLLRLAATALLVLAIPLLPETAARLWGAAPYQDEKPDVVLVLAAGVGGDAELGVWPTDESSRRAAVGVATARRFGVPLIYSGGATGLADRSEASVMRDFFPYEGHTILDEAALSTWESAPAVVDILAAENLSRVLLVTDSRHGRRSLAVMAKAGVPVVGFQNARRPPAFSLDDLVPSISGLATWRIVGYELAGTLYYALKGRLDIVDAVLVAPWIARSGSDEPASQ